MGLFGLFSKANKEEKGKEVWRDTRPFEVFKNIDYLDENNELYLNVVEDIVLNKHAELPNIDMCRVSYKYYVIYYFLCNVLNEEATIFLIGEELKTIDGYYAGEHPTDASLWGDLCNICDFLKWWTIEDILDREDWLVRYFKSPKFNKVAQYFYENKLSLRYNFYEFYNFYAREKFAEEDLSDESIVFYPEFVVMCSKGDEGHIGEDALRLLEIYHELEDNPELRKKILFKDDSYLRGYNYIMMDYKKYRENGSL